MSVNSGNFSEDFSTLSLEEKIETILSMLNTPIVRRKLVDYELSMLQQRPITNLKNLKKQKMVSPDIIKLSSEEFMTLVEKYESEAVKEYKKEVPEMRDSYIRFWVPVNEKQCRKCFIDELKSEYLKNGWKQVDIKFVEDRTTSLMICLRA